FRIGNLGSQQIIQLQPGANGGGLPPIVDDLTIDAWSQGGPGYAGPPLIQVTGATAVAGADGSPGLTIQSSNVTIQGLSIVNFVQMGAGSGFAIELSNARATPLSNINLFGNS